MQTTLLGFAIAVILALLAALLGPYYVDWNQHRARFEAEASRLTGLPVRITGDIDARMLPSPALILRGVEFGAGEGNVTHVQALSVEFALGALLRGEFRAAEMRIAGAELTLALDADGRLSSPGLALGFNADALSIDRVAVEDARLILTDSRSGFRLPLDKLWFDGEMRSFAGPLRGTGAFVARGGLYSYRLATGRAESGAVRIKMNLEPARYPATAELDGALILQNGVPRFEGNATLARAAGAVMAGQAVMSEPWRVSARAKISPAAALFEQTELHYGPEQQALKLEGVGELKFGSSPRFDATLSAHQLDLDQIIVAPDVPRHAPAIALQLLAEKFAAGLQPSIPAQIGIVVESLSLGGGNIQSLRADLSRDTSGWNLAHLEFRAPGFTKVLASGRLDLSGPGPGFEGAIDATAIEPRVLAAWLTGRKDVAAAATKPLRLAGDLTLKRDALALEHLRAEIDRQHFQGRFSYASTGGKTRLAAELRGDEIDLDGMVEFSESALGDIPPGRSVEIALGCDFGRARLAGMDMRNAKAQVTFDNTGLRVERLAFENFGGLTLHADGHVDMASATPRGELTLDLSVQDWSGPAALAGKFAPTWADAVRRFGDFARAAKMRAIVNLSPDASREGSARTRAMLTLDGEVADLRLALKAQGIIAGDDFTSPDVQIEGKVGMPGFASDEWPVNLAAKMRIAAEAIALEGFSGSLAGIPIKGDLRLALHGMSLAGQVDAAAIEFDRLLALAAGMPRDDARDRPPDRFRRTIFQDLTGLIDLRAERAVLPIGTAEHLKARLRLAPPEIAVEDLQASAADGHISGRVLLLRQADGLAVRSEIILKNADLSRLDAALPLQGRLGVHLSVESAGLTPRGLIGALAGGGTFTLDGAEMSELNPRVFAAAAQAIDLGVAADANGIRDVITQALASGPLKLPHVEGKVTLRGERLQVVPLTIAGEGADLGLSGRIDLADRSLDARFVLADRQISMMGARPELTVAFKGPLADAKRTLDISTFTRWLTLRAVEQQSRRLEEIQAPPTAKSRERERTSPAKPIKAGETKMAPGESAPPLGAPIDIKPAPGRRPAAQAYPEADLTGVKP